MDELNDAELSGGQLGAETIEPGGDVGAGDYCGGGYLCTALRIRYALG